MEVLLLVWAFHASAQKAYVSPLGPEEKVQFTALFGEIRSTHLHAGVDISTQGKEGHRIYAVSDGYVARLRVSDKGYGKCVYVRHDDGNTSVYAHLMGFQSKINRWVVGQQYARKSFEIDISLPPILLPVQAGDAIGYVGNTGRSSAPHLHFELRNKAQKALDPLRFNFPDVLDKVSPVITHLIIKTTDIAASVNGQFGFHNLPVVGSNGRYQLTKGLFVKGCVVMSVEAHMPLGKQNSGGVSNFSLQVDGQPVYAVEVDEVDFAYQHHVHAHAEHKLLTQENKKYTKLYAYPRNPMPYYTTNQDRGVHCFVPERPSTVKIIAKTHQGLTATLLFRVNETTKFLPLSIVHHDNAFISHELLDNMLFVRTLKRVFGRELLVYTASSLSGEAILPAYYLEGHNVYLWDMQRGVPHRVRTDESHWTLPLYAVPAGGGTISTADMVLTFAERALYQPFYVELWREEINGQEFFTMENGHVPLRAAMTVVLKPTRYYPSEKTSVYVAADDGGRNWLGGVWQGRHLSYNTRAFGTYTLLTDNVPPVVRVQKQDAIAGVVLYVQDNLSGVASWEATIRGTWLLMEYSSKENTLRSVAMEADFSYAGIFEVIVYDHEGNSRSMTLRIPKA